VRAGTLGKSRSYVEAWQTSDLRKTAEKDGAWARDANYEMLKRELKGPERATVPKLRIAKNIDEATLFFMK
jgi:hypothetical protein